MPNKRVSLADRRQQDRQQQGQGDDAFFTAPAQVTREIGSVPLVKLTMYVRPDQKRALDLIQLQAVQAGQPKPDKQDLVQEALDLLTQKYGLT